MLFVRFLYRSKQGAPPFCHPVCRLLQLLRDSRRPDSLIVLFHAQWCPFSKAFLQLFRCLPQYFRRPVTFIALEASQLSQSDTIKLGLHAYPLLRLYHHQVGCISRLSPSTCARLCH